MLPLPALVKPPVPERRPEKLVLVLPTSVSVAPRMMLPLPAIDATLSVPVRFQVAPLAMLGRSDVIAMPHIGASTEESEENCAVMAANQLMEYLESGNIVNSVNFPAVSMPRTPGTWRITFSNDNVSGVLGHVLSVLAEHQVNVIDMMNKSRSELAFNIVDVEHQPSAAVVAAIEATQHVIRVRVIDR